MSTHTLTTRTTVDPAAPKAPTRLWALLVTLRSALIALPTLPYLVLRYYLVKPKIPLLTWLITKFIDALNARALPLPSPETTKARWGKSRVLGGAAPGVSTTIVEVPPAPASLLQAYATIPPVSDIKPLEMPGYLMGGDDPASPGEKLILYFHGGAYVLGHPLLFPLPSYLSKELGVRVFSGQYRKCITPDTAFPGPLIDALAAWHYITFTLGFEPSNIIISGDSAGGHLCLSLLQQLSALGNPLPGGAALMSPWADLTCSFPSWKTHTNDYLALEKIKGCVRSMVRYYEPEAVRGPFLSPALAPVGYWKFLDHTPILISVGTAEVFYDEDMAVAEGMERDGVPVTVQKHRNGIHVSPVLDLILKTETGEYKDYRTAVGKLLKGLGEAGAS